MLSVSNVISLILVGTILGTGNISFADGNNYYPSSSEPKNIVSLINTPCTVKKLCLDYNTVDEIPDEIDYEEYKLGFWWDGTLNLESTKQYNSYYEATFTGTLNANSDPSSLTNNESMPKTKKDYVNNMINNLSNIDFLKIENLQDLNPTLPTNTTDIKVQDKNEIQFITQKEQSVLSPVDGTVAEVVSYAEKDRDDLVPTMGYGSIIIIEDTNQNKYMLSHLGSVDCKKGDELKVGDIVGTTGTTGRALNPMVGFSLVTKDKNTVNINFN